MVHRSDEKENAGLKSLPEGESPAMLLRKAHKACCHQKILVTEKNRNGKERCIRKPALSHQHFVKEVDGPIAFLVCSDEPEAMFVCTQAASNCSGGAWWKERD